MDYWRLADERESKEKMFEARAWRYMDDWAMEMSLDSVWDRYILDETHKDYEEARAFLIDNWLIL